MKTDYFIFLGLYFFGLIIRAVYEELKKKSRLDPTRKITFTVIFAAMCMMWASWFNMCPMDPFRFSVPFVIRWLGLGTFLAGLGLAIGAVIQLRGLENIDHLVTKGLFSKIRHPMYVGFILWIFGWAVYHGAVMSLCFGFAAVGNILYWQRLEERELESKYGEVYLKYRSETWL